MTAKSNPHTLTHDFQTHLVNKFSSSVILSPCNLFQNSQIRYVSHNHGEELKKKRLHPRTQDGDNTDDYDNDVFDTNLSINKKVKTNSSLDKSCFVAVVTASNLSTDKLYLPQYFTSSNCLTRKCLTIVLIDQGKRSWAFDLSFDDTCDSFYICQGWSNFCEENGQITGGTFTFKLVASGETLVVLRFFSTQSCNDTREREFSEARKEKKSEDKCSSMESDTTKSIIFDREKEDCLEAIEKKKKESRSWERKNDHSSQKQFVTLKIHPWEFKRRRLCLPAKFWRGNNMSKPGGVILLGKDGTKWSASLVREAERKMRLGKGWNVFAEANDLKVGDSFTFKLIWEDTTPVLSLCSTECIIDDENEQSTEDNNTEENNQEEREKNHPSCIDLTSPRGNQFLTTTIKLNIRNNSRMCLPKRFAKENSMNKSEMIYLLGKDGKKWNVYLSREGDGRMGLGKGWKAFAEANDFKLGQSVTLELIREEDETPVLRFLFTENKKEKRERNQPSYIYSTSPRENRFLTLIIKPNILSRGKMCLPKKFTKDNCMDEPGMVYLLGKDGKKWNVYLIREGGRRMVLTKGWRAFAKANDLKLGQSVTLELLREEDSTPVLRFLFKEPNNSSKDNKKKSHGNRDYSFTAIQTLTLTHEDIKAVKLHLTREFMKANGITRLGKITILGENGMERIGYLLSKEHESVTLGIGWDDLSEANGVKLGQSFTLDNHFEQDETKFVLKFSSVETN